VLPKTSVGKLDKKVLREKYPESQPAFALCRRIIKDEA